MLKEYPDHLSTDDTQDKEFQKTGVNLPMGNKEDAKEIIYKDLKSKFEMENLEEHEEHGETDSMKQYILDCSEKAEELRMIKIERNESSENNRLAICEISLDDYVKYGDYFPKDAYFDSDTVYLPAMVHSTFHEHIVRHTDYFFAINLLKYSMMGAGEMSCFIKKKTEKRADCSYVPFDVIKKEKPAIPKGKQPYPTLVVEIAYKNEKLDRLMYEIMDWISPFTNVQIAIGLKIERDKKGDIVTFVYAEKGWKNPILHEIGIIDRQGELVNHSKLPKIRIPIKLLFHDALVPQEFKKKKNVLLDLRAYSEVVLKCIAGVDRNDFDE